MGWGAEVQITATMLFWPLLASGQISIRKVDGWQTLATKFIDQRIDLAARPLLVAALTFPLRRGDVDYVVFCFGKLEDVEVLRPSCGDRRRSYKNGRPGKTVLGPSSFQPMMVTTGRTGTPHRQHQSSQTARRGSELA
jgi:hypothetical protein